MQRNNTFLGPLQKESDKKYKTEKHIYFTSNKHVQEEMEHF